MHFIYIQMEKLIGNQLLLKKWSSSAGANSYNEIFALNFINILKNYAISWFYYAQSEIHVNGNEFV